MSSQFQNAVIALRMMAFAMQDSAIIAGSEGDSPVPQHHTLWWLRAAGLYASLGGA